MENSPFHFLVIYIVAFLISIFITRWIFRIDEIVALLKENNKLLKVKEITLVNVENDTKILNFGDPQIILPAPPTDEEIKEAQKEENNKIMVGIFMIIMIVVAIIAVVSLNSKNIPQ